LFFLVVLTRIILSNYELLYHSLKAILNTHRNTQYTLTEIKIYIYSHKSKSIYTQYSTWSTMCGLKTWWYVTPSRRYSSHLIILFEHSPQRGLGKRIYLLILFSTLLTGYVSSLLFYIVLLLAKWRVSFISIYNYLYRQNYTFSLLT